ncbi:MAG: hypothetical protein RM021_026610 [Nostoc sp. EkiNYC01]|nr:hypothetical protein [Nostoc sp. EkiNYC01]
MKLEKEFEELVRKIDIFAAGYPTGRTVMSETTLSVPVIEITPT